MQQNIIQNLSLKEEQFDLNKLTYKDLIQLDGHEKCVDAVTISNDGKFMVSASFKQLILWDVEQKSIKFEFNYTGGDSKDIVCSYDNKWLAAVDKLAIVIFNLTNLQKEPSITLKGHSDIVYRIAFTMNSKFLISGSVDKTLRIWDVEQQNCIVVKKLSDLVFGVSISLNQNLISAGCSNGYIYLFDSSNIEDIIELTKWKVSEYVFCTIFTSDSKNVFIGCQKLIQLWSIEQLLSKNESKVPLKVMMCKNLVWSMHLKMNDSLLISNDGEIKIWNSANGELIKTLEAPGGYGKVCWEQNVAVASDMKYIITGGENKKMNIYQLESN